MSVEKPAYIIVSGTPYTCREVPLYKLVGNELERQINSLQYRVNEKLKDGYSLHGYTINTGKSLTLTQPMILPFKLAEYERLSGEKEMKTLFEDEENQ